MKKLRYIFELLILTSILISCNSQEETKHLGIDAEIVSIDGESEVLTVKDISDSGIFGEASKIDCKDSDIIYCNYKTKELKTIKFEDLSVGDDIILEINDSEFLKLKDNKDSEQTIKINQVQLGTQRL